MVFLHDVCLVKMITYLQQMKFKFLTKIIIYYNKSIS